MRCRWRPGLGGCIVGPATDSFLGIITPYRIDIVQGNVVTKEQVALVKPGLTRAQVRDMLGSPLLTDTFHADRWDYLFTIRRQGAEPQRRSVVAHFEGDVLKRSRRPSCRREREFVASISRTRASAQADARARADAESSAAALPVPPQAGRRRARRRRASGPVRDYPPLEPQIDAAARCASRSPARPAAWAAC